jgi:hypothetical protein
VFRSKLLRSKHFPEAGQSRWPVRWSFDAITGSRRDGVTSPLVGGLVVSALTFSGAIAVLLLRNASAHRILSGGMPAPATGIAIRRVAAGPALWAMSGPPISGLGNRL